MQIKSFKLFLFFFVILLGCQSNGNLLINHSHLDYLYEEIKIDGIEMAIVHIYSDYPEYNYVGDDDEGFACVDDAARAAVYYLHDWELSGEKESIRKNKMLLEFLLYMQAENGYFYNFIWDDYSINKDFKTSVAEPNWWSWRALWVLTESYGYYKSNDPEFAERVLNSIERLAEAIRDMIPAEYNYDIIAGVKLPTWLPYKYAADQAAVLLLGLAEYYKLSDDAEIYNYMKKLCYGIIEMQLSESEFKGAFLSWQNNWHAWGNLQSYALLKVYPLVNDQKLLTAALSELDNFFPYLISNGYLNSFSVEEIDGKLSITEKSDYSQIAYNIRPMVYAMTEAYNITGNKVYAERASSAAKWLTGSNPAGTAMYDPETGRVFDGINSVDFINKNSGAESTIEGLLTLNKIKQTTAALNSFLKND